MSVATSPSWDLLDEKEEIDLHKSRLLKIEEKPFKRITKRLVAMSTLQLNAKLRTPATENGNVDDPSAAPPQTAVFAEAHARELARLHEDLMLDFAAFDCNIARLQFQLDANSRERKQYVEKQQNILVESAAVQARNAELRDQLETARATLAKRKRFDELADQITSNRALRPRAEQRAVLLKLEEECAELERESESYKATWRERRDQFNKIMDEGMNLRRLIRDEKEEVERREGMNEGGDGGDAAEDGDASGEATPHVDRGASRDANTPGPGTSAGRRTPATAAGSPQESGPAERNDGLKPTAENSGSMSRSGSRGPDRELGRERSPALTVAAETEGDEEDGEVEEGEDVEMEDPGRSVTAAHAPQITVDAPEAEAEAGGDKMQVDSN